MRKTPALCATAICIAVVACGPDLSKIHVSGCVKQCNADNQVCLNDANAVGDACTDTACEQGVLRQSETCINTTLSCYDACITQLEQTLK